MPPNCEIHGVALVCPACLGAMTSLKKARAARRNGAKGGRPRQADKPKPKRARAAAAQGA